MHCLITNDRFVVLYRVAHKYDHNLRAKQNNSILHITDEK